MTGIRLGADPEVFLVHPSGKLVSAIGYINAGKDNPFQIPDMPKGFTLQEDNVSLEYGIPPASNAKELYNHLTSVMEKSLEYVPGLGFSRLSCAVFDADQMTDPAAHVFGCEPDSNAWTKEFNPSPVPDKPYMRSAGGHIHVETKENPVKVVRCMDLFLGVPSVLMDHGDERRKLYGKAGAHRIKPYGVEYRTLSNFWVFEEKLIDWVWRNTEAAVQYAPHDWVDEFEKEINRAINLNDKKMARELVDALALEVV